MVFGTRPEAIKLAPVIWHSRNHNIDLCLVWSGQHYDYELGRVFFEELKLPDPDYNLKVGSGTHGQQTARIIERLEKVVLEENPAVIVAQGDTNTVLGAALVAAKCKIPFAHVEAGLRSYDRTMPEEINRIVADAVAELCFAPTERAALNLLYEGIFPWKIFITGNTIVDVVLKYREKAVKEAEKLLTELALKEYCLATVHRAENTDNPTRLKNIFKALNTIADQIPVVFPIHPRTRNKAEKYSILKLLEKENIYLTKPLGYFKFLGLLAKTKIVLTDSGGVQEEALTLKTPCITLRYNTERPETVEAGGNILAGTEVNEIIQCFKHTIKHINEIKEKLKKKPNPLGDGKAGQKITQILQTYIQKEKKITSPDYRHTGHPTYILVKGKKYAEITIKELTQKYPFIHITLLYNEKGKPRLPQENTIIKEKYLLRIWGPEYKLKSLNSSKNSFKQTIQIGFINQKTLPH